MQQIWSMTVFLFVLKIVLIDGNCRLSDHDNVCVCNSMGSNIEMSCSADSKSKYEDFKITYGSLETVMITCKSDKTLSSFNIDITSVSENVKTFFLKNCTLGDTEIRNVSQLVGAENATKFIFVDARDNKNITLHKSHFRGFSQINSLEVSDNDNFILDQDLLEYLPNLESLILRNNKIKNIPNNFFRNTLKLKILELGNNEITNFESETFRNLKNLTFLSIWTNKLQVLDNRIFSDLVSLKVLNLLNNNLSTLPSEIFYKNVKLNTIVLSQNSFTSLPEGLFKNNNDLTLVKLQSARNLTSLPSGLLSNLVNLDRVFLTGCSLKSIPEDLFEGSTNLRQIFLNTNALQTLPAKIFDGLQHLEKLQLNNNEIESIPATLFKSCGRLKELNVNNNKIERISSFTFEGLLGLRKLFMMRNKLTDIDTDTFVSLPNIVNINLSHNNIINVNSGILSALGDISLFNMCLKLEQLDLSYNKIPSMFSDWIVTPGNFFRHLDLSHNAISYLTVDDLDFKHSQNFTINLSNNKISTIYMSNYEARFTMERRSNIVLNIEKNPLECDCVLYDLIRYLDGSMNKAVLTKLKIQIGYMECSDSNQYNGVRLIDLRSENYKCTPSENYFDDSNLCPAACNQQITPSERKFTFNCAFRNLTKAPEVLCSLRDSSFSTTLDLTGNFIKTIPDFQQIGYERVNNLLLSHNQISYVTKEIFANNELKKLELSNNEIRSLYTDVLGEMRLSKTIVTLGGNAWNCDCNARHFLNFTQNYNNTVEDMDNIICEDSNTILRRLSVQELCLDKTKVFVIASLCLSFLGLVIGFIGYFYYRYQWEIKLWFYANSVCLWYVSRKPDKNKLPLAFVSYSPRDEKLAIKRLITNLETGPNFVKFYIHFRHWSVGERISAQLLKSVRNSKKTALLVSPNFIINDCGKLEYKATPKEALARGRVGVFVVLYGDAEEIGKLDPELQEYLKLNPYVKWVSLSFWDKLEYLLPYDSSFLLKSFMSKNSKRLHLSRRLNFKKSEGNTFTTEEV